MTVFRIDPDHAGMRAAAAPPVQQLAGPVAVDEYGYIATSTADAAESPDLFLHPGARLGWIPVPECGGVILVQFGGAAAEDGFEEDGLAAFYTLAGFGQLVDDLQAVAWQVAGGRDPKAAQLAIGGLDAVAADVLRWCAHVERWAYERVDHRSLDSSPHLLAAAARKLVALAVPGQADPTRKHEDGAQHG